MPWTEDELDRECDVICSYMADLYTANQKWEAEAHVDYDVEWAISLAYRKEMYKLMGVGRATGRVYSGLLYQAVEEAKGASEDGTIDIGLWSGDGMAEYLYKWFNLDEWELI